MHVLIVRCNHAVKQDYGNTGIKNRRNLHAFVSLSSYLLSVPQPPCLLLKVKLVHQLSLALCLRGLLHP